MDKNLTIMASLIGAITQTSEWFDTCQKDPQITASRERLDTVLERVGALIPEDLLDELQDAICAMDEAQETAAILYGIRVAIAIRDVSTRQTDLSQHIITTARLRAAV